MIDLRHIRYFQAVAEELSFSKASRRLHVAQPALSRALKELEEYLGVLLLARTRRSVSLTPAGGVLLHDSALVLQRMDEAFRRAQRTAAGEEGELRLGYIGPPTQDFMGRVLSEYASRYPRVSVVLEERTPERVWEMVARGRLAIGLTRPVLAHEALGLKTLLLRKEPLWAVLRKTDPLAVKKALQWRELADQPLVILSRREGVGLFEEIMLACRRARFTPKLTHTPSLMGTVLSYVEAGAGIGIMSDSVTLLGHGGPFAFRPIVPVHTVDLVMVWSEDNDTPTALAFRNLMTEKLRSGTLWSAIKGAQPRGGS
jgi:DNA-binding transcriptional LysR family regulator